MDYAKVTGIIRAVVLDKVEKRLLREGVAGMSVTKVEGCGELKDFFVKDWLVTHARFEVFTPAADAERIARAIAEEAHSGESGDGVVAILPVQVVFKIRTGAPLGVGAS